MIDDKSIYWYFNNMKTKGSIPELYDYNGFTEENTHIKIYYTHKSGKRYSYRFLKELVTQEIRDSKIKSILGN